MDRAKGFTLVEMIVVIGITGILLALLVPQISGILAKVDRISCMSHMRQLWVYFSPCATDGQGWPQLPAGVAIGSRDEERFWIGYASTNLGVPPSLWRCPSIDRVSRRSAETNNLPLIHYLPTLFDSRPGTPNKWPSMPWFSEIADVHGGGNLIITSGGSIVTSTPMQ